MKRSWLAEFYSRISLWRKLRVPAENILLLLPRCLQNDECNAKIARSIDSCGRCGRCDLTDIFALKEKYGIRVVVAAGGRQAVEAARRADVKAIVAIACAKELMLGILGVFPKPVISVYNHLSSGPCFNTRIAAQDVEAAIRRLMHE